MIDFPAERRLTLIQSYTSEAFINNSLEVDLFCSCLYRDRVKEWRRKSIHTLNVFPAKQVFKQFGQKARVELYSQCCQGAAKAVHSLRAGTAGDEGGPSTGCVLAYGTQSHRPRTDGKGSYQ